MGRTHSHSVGSIVAHRRRLCAKGGPSPIPTGAPVTLELLSSLAHLSLLEAAAAVAGMSATSFKRACRKLGIRRWAYKRGRNSEAAEATGSSAAAASEPQRKIAFGSDRPKGAAQAAAATETFPAPNSGEPGLLCSDLVDVSQRFWGIGCDAGGGPETPPDSVLCPSERPAAARCATEAASCAPAVDDAKQEARLPCVPISPDAWVRIPQGPAVIKIGASAKARCLSPPAGGAAPGCCCASAPAACRTRELPGGGCPPNRRFTKVASNLADAASGSAARPSDRTSSRIRPSHWPLAREPALQTRALQTIPSNGATGARPGVSGHQAR